MKNKLLFLLFIITSTSAIAQISNEKRIEFELKDGYDKEDIIVTLSVKTGLMMKIANIEIG